MIGYLSPNEFRSPFFSGWGIFLFVYIPLAVLFPALILPLLLSVSFLLHAGLSGTPVPIPPAGPVFSALEARLLRAPPLA